MSDIHPTAIVAPEAKLHPTVTVGPYAIIESGAEIGADSIIESHARVYGFTKMGKANRVCHGATIGSEPQDMAYTTENAKRLYIGDNNVFREKSDVSHGIKEEHGTIIGSNNYFMVATHVGHDCILGDNNIFANTATLAGHVELGSNVYVSGHTGIHQFCKVGSLAMVSAHSVVTQDVPPYVLVDGHRAQIVGLNVVGLRRAGLDAGARSEIKKAYKTIYKSDLRLLEALEELKANSPSKTVQNIIDFIGGSTRGLVSHR